MAQSKKGSTSKKAAENSSDKVLWSTVLFALGVLIAAFAIIKGESVWLGIHNIILGLFGVATFLVPVVLIYAAIMIAADKSKSAISSKVMQGAILTLLFCAIIQIFFADDMDDTATLRVIVATLYENGKEFSGGGLLSIVLGLSLMALFGRTGAGIIVVLLTFVFIMLLMNKTIIDLFKFIRNLILKATYDRGEYEEVEDFVPSPSAVAHVKAEKENKKKAKAQKPTKETVPNSDVPKDIAEKNREGFNIDIPMNKKPISKKAEKKLDTPIFTSNTEPEKPKTETEKQVDEINDYIEKMASEKTNLSQTATVSGNAASDSNNDLASIIQKAADKAEADRKANINPFKKADNKKKSTLASNEIEGNEGLELETLTAQDIQNEIAENAPQKIEYVFPPIELLKIANNDVNSADAVAEMQQNADTLVETLKSFGVMTRIVDIHRGPTVTRYELQPNAGVKISKITGLADDIALNLAAESVRIEAPIPGKAAVGIEVPNRIKDTVSLREIIDSDEFRANKSKLTFVVGKNIDGQIILGDIAKLPHIIIAGTTGSGKSVCTNGIIMSILYNATPDEVRLVLIDPKIVEFKIYDGIPHLLIPVVTDPRKAAGALAWAVQEMLKRYKLFADNNVRDLSGYNEMAEVTDGIDPLPRIVIVIDELADLMMAAAGEVEDSICRLAQMARAAGMHLIIATQRPTVDVITGLIKANIPSRIALKVSSGIDSRAILDKIGAEKLLGYGDLLYAPNGAPKPVRVQNCFTSSKEVAAVVDYIKNGVGDVVYDDNIIQEIENAVPMQKGEKPGDSGKDYSAGSDEDLAERAIECAVEAGQISVTYIQRKLKLGYAKAARIVDMLEEMGVVGPHEGAKPRRVLMSREQFLQRKMNGGFSNQISLDESDEMVSDVPFDED